MQNILDYLNRHCWYTRIIKGMPVPHLHVNFLIQQTWEQILNRSWIKQKYNTVIMNKHIKAWTPKVKLYIALLFSDFFMQSS